MKTTDEILMTVPRLAEPLERTGSEYLPIDKVKMAMNVYASQMILENENKWTRKLELLIKDLEKFSNHSRIDVNSKESFGIAIQQVKKYKDYEL